MNLSVPAAKILRRSRKNQLPPEDRFQDKMSPGNRHEKAVRIEKNCTVQQIPSRLLLMLKLSSQKFPLSSLNKKNSRRYLENNNGL